MNGSESSYSGSSNIDDRPAETDDSDGSGDFYNNSEEDDLDVDSPRITQWVPEEDNPAPRFRGLSDKGEGSSRKALRDLQEDLSSLPFQTLLKAKRAVEQVRNDSDSESEDTDSQGNFSEQEEPIKGRVDVKATESAKRVEKRTNKHAPLEMSSKRPVSRKRQIVELKKVNSRDPRFSPLSGELQPAVFQKRYEFLAGMHKKELSALKENLKRAKKMLRSSPRDQREERESEVQRLERAVKRAESSVNRDGRERVEREALGKAVTEERARRKAGKGEWYLKNAEKKEILLRARHDALAQKGGRLAVKKAIEKKQKKISQKEKKRRPSFLSRPNLNESDGERLAGSKRRAKEAFQHYNKRQRKSI